MTVEYARMAEQSHRYFLDNEKQLRLEYAGQYVAIAGEEVVASAPENEELIEKVESSDYSMEEVFVKYVRDEGEKVVR